jgi:hypothetical protein
MNYKETIATYTIHCPMFSRIGAAAYKKDIINTIAVV